MQVVDEWYLHLAHSEIAQLVVVLLLDDELRCMLREPWRIREPLLLLLLLRRPPPPLPPAFCARASATKQAAARRRGKVRTVDMPLWRMPLLLVYVVLA